MKKRIHPVLQTSEHLMKGNAEEMRESTHAITVFKAMAQSAVYFSKE